jgi:hypothetical protein
MMADASDYQRPRTPWHGLGQLSNVPDGIPGSILTVMEIAIRQSYGM